MFSKRIWVWLGIFLLQVLALALASISAAPSQQVQSQQASIPEEARKDFVQGNLFFKEAHSKEDYVKAESLYKQAVKLAPEWGNAWYNLSKVQEKLEEYDDAMASLKLFLQYSPKDPDSRAAQDHVYELEVKRDTQAKLIADQKHTEWVKVAHLRDAQQKADYLRQQLAGLRLEASWTCIPSKRLPRNGFIPGCTDAEAKEKNWIETPGSREEASAPLVIFNSEWNGQPAIYIERCSDGTDCIEKSRDYFVFRH